MFRLLLFIVCILAGFVVGTNKFVVDKASCSPDQVIQIVAAVQRIVAAAPGVRNKVLQSRANPNLHPKFVEKAIFLFGDPWEYALGIFERDLHRISQLRYHDVGNAVTDAEWTKIRTYDDIQYHCNGAHVVDNHDAETKDRYPGKDLNGGRLLDEDNLNGLRLMVSGEGDSFAATWPSTLTTPGVPDHPSVPQLTVFNPYWLQALSEDGWPRIDAKMIEEALEDDSDKMLETIEEQANLNDQNLRVLLIDVISDSELDHTIFHEASPPDTWALVQMMHTYHGGFKDDLPPGNDEHAYYWMPIVAYRNQKNAENYAMLWLLSRMIDQDKYDISLQGTIYKIQ